MSLELILFEKSKMVFKSSCFKESRYTFLNRLLSYLIYWGFKAAILSSVEYPVPTSSTAISNPPCFEILLIMSKYTSFSCGSCDENLSVSSITICSGDISYCFKDCVNSSSSKIGKEGGDKFINIFLRAILLLLLNAF